MLNIKKNYIPLLIFFFSLIFFIFKWHLSFLSFVEEVSVRIIFDSVGDGYYYLSHFKALTNFEFNNSFDPFINNLKNITITFGGFFFHLIFYLFFNEWSFIILEFFFILFFLVVFYKISRLLKIGKIQSLAISIFIFNIPFFFEVFNADRMEYFNIIASGFYSFRFPRPMVTNLFYFLFVFLVLKENHKRVLTSKNSIIFALISGFAFSSHLYFFILEQLFILFSLIFVFKLHVLKNLKSNIKFILIYIFTFLIVSSPSLINAIFTEIDFLERLGFKTPDLSQRVILLKYLFFKLFKIKFLFTFLLSILIFSLINFNKKYLIFKKINPLFILFYLSIISPFIYVAFSPAFFSHIYIFNNIIIVNAFLLFFFLICIFLNYYINKKMLFKLGNGIALITILVSMIVNYSQSKKNYIELNLSSDRLIQRLEFNSIVKTIRKYNFLEKKESALLTFDNRFLVWSILNNIDYLNIINGVLTSRTNLMLENNLINTFKYLKLNKKDFIKFIENRKIDDWRYRNENIKNLFWMRYQANSLITFNDSKNFEKNIINFINNSSPLLSQQLIMPNEEIERFVAKFENSINSNYSNPKMIIINKNNFILAKSKIDPAKFCKSFEGDYYDFYYSFKLKENCNN